MENHCRPLARYRFGVLSQWLQSALKAAGRTQTEVAHMLTERLGRSIDRAAVNKMVKGTRKISADELIELARFLNKPAPLQTTGLRTVRVASHVQAGHWAESWEWPAADQYDVVVPDDPTLDGFSLYGAETRGPSMNRRYPDRTVVVFTDAIETQESPMPGKRYVVQRRRADGLHEHTVKLLHQDASGVFWLLPESTDPLFQEPIQVDFDTAEEDEVRIVGRVRYSVARE